MVENIDIVHRNPKFDRSWPRNRKQLREKKEETPPVPPQKPNVVTLPVPEAVPPPLLVAECKRPGKISHPAIRWSLYALGGFLIIRWAWKRWKSEDDEDKK